MIGQLWESFWKAVSVPGMPPEQHQEMRRAFYAGCWGMLQQLKNIGSDAISEDAGAATLQRCEDELRRFQKDVTEGRA